MKKYAALLSAILAVGCALFCETGALAATTKYWRLSTAASGSAGGSAPAGNWDVSTLNWDTTSTGTGSHVAFASGDTAVFSAAGDATGAFTITMPSALSAGALTVEEGTVTKSGSALTTQTITINSGATFLYNSSGGIVASVGATCTLNGGTFGYTSGGVGGTFLTANMGIVLNGGGILSDAIGNPNVYSGVISGTGDLTKVGAGILAITTTCTYSGNTIVNNGVLRLRTGSPQIPNTALTVTSPGGFDPATFSQTVATLSGSGSIPFSGTGTLTISGSGSTVHSGVISGNGSSITRSGTGSTTLRGVNTHTGLFNITGGTITVATGASLCGATCDLQVDGGTLSLTNTTQTVEDFGGAGGTVILNTGVTLTTTGTFVSSARTTNYAGVIAGPGNLNVAAGIQTLSGPNTYTGTTTVQSGAALKVYNATALGDTGTGTTVNSGGAVQIAGTYSVAEPLTLNGVGTNGLNGALRNTAQVNTWSGAITLGSSGVRINSDTAGTLNLSGGITGSGNALTIGGVGTVSISTSQINIGSATLTKDGTGTLTLITANTFGATSMSAGRINVQATDCLGQGTVTISPTNFTTIANNGSGDVTLANNFMLNSSAFNIDISATSTKQLLLNGKISGAANWKKDNSAALGTLVLNNSANDFSGNLTNFAGIIAAAANNALGTTAGITIVNSSATLGFQGGINYSTAEPVTISGTGRLGMGAIANLQADNNTFAGPITLAADSTLGAAAGGTLTLNGNINGAFALTKTNSGTVNLGGSNGYTGNTTILLGTLGLTGSGAINSSPFITISNGAALDVSGHDGGSYALASGQTLKGNGGVNGVIIVAAGATVAPGASIGTLYFTNAPTLAGTTAMELNKAAGPILTGDKLVVTTGGGTLTYGGTLVITASGLALTNTDTFDLFDADTFSGSFTAVTPATPGTGLRWYTNQLPVDGTISVACSGTLAVNVGLNTNTCSGVGVQLGASASAGSGTGYAYSWSPGTGLSSTTVANPIASPATTTTYTVTATDSVGCTAQSSVTVGVDVAPAITAQPANTTNCSGTTATFSVGATGSGLMYSWAKHNNGGWGSAWSTSGGGATFRQTSTQNNFGDGACTGFSSANDINSPSGNALAMWGGFSGDEVATRDFAALSAGQDVSIDFDNGNVDGGSKVGFSLEDSGGSDILQFYFVGGQSNYKYWDTASAEQDTGMGFQRTGLRVQFILLSGSTYKLIVTACGGSSSTFTGSYAGTIARLKLFNQNNTGGDDKNIYFNNFIVGGYTDNADNYSGDYAGQDKEDQPILTGNGGSTYTTPVLSVADSGTQYEVVVYGCSGTVLSSAATVTVNPPATVNAGPDQTVCADSPAVTLAGSFGGAASSATWSGGAGVFGNAAVTNTTYIPSAGEITAGSVTLTLTTSDPAGPCGPVNDSMTITINPAATVNAGPDQTVCADSPAVTLAGSFGGAAMSASWSTAGTGTFDDTNALGAVYTPSGADINAGSVTLTLTTDDPSGPCGAVSDSMVVTFDRVTATNVTFVHPASSPLKISKTNLLAHAADADAEMLTLTGVGTDGADLLTTNGATLSADANWIYYTNSVTPSVNDSFAYKVTDARGCVALGTVFINVLQNETGLSTGISISNGVATVDFAGIPGRSYDVQRSTNLVDWTTLVTTNAPAAGVFRWVDDFSDLGVPPADPPSSAYYRLRVP